MIIESSFKSSFPINNGHLETIIPYYFRKVEDPHYQRERLELADGDFLDLDWVISGNKKLVVISHGLEGSSRSTHIKGQVHSLEKNGYDVLVWNCRGCSGETNRLLRSYHSGISSDLNLVMSSVCSRYEEVYLLGHSMGGNITLKYLAEKGEDLPSQIKGAFVLSTPMCLKSSSYALAKGFNKVYTKHFISSLVKKVEQKNKLFNDSNYNLSQIKNFKSFQEFDDLITAPIHGFKDALDYWTQCSTFNHLSKISCATLIVNALNDPFLDGNCYPLEQVKNLSQVYLEIPDQGGHVGFLHKSSHNKYWNELRALEFFSGLKP